MKKIICCMIALILFLSCSAASAERRTVVKNRFYIGAMKVVRCRESVSLRATPDKTGTVLAKVPVNAVVLYCDNNVNHYKNARYRKQADLFIHCEYDGQEGYILSKYLQRAPEFEPAETRQDNEVMTKEAIAEKGEVILSWNEYNVSVLASYEEVNEDGAAWEYIHVGCFINDEPNWGYTEAVRREGKPLTLKAFMGGTEDEPMVCIYDEGYALLMLDLMDGTEVWSIMKHECAFGDASAIAVEEEGGNMYIAGSNGPDPVAVSVDGEILWRSDIDDASVSGPAKITLNVKDIEVDYDNGKTVLLRYDGKVISISE